MFSRKNTSKIAQKADFPKFGRFYVIRYAKCSEFHCNSHGRLNLMSCKLITLTLFGGARKKCGDAAPNQYTGAIQRLGRTNAAPNQFTGAIQRPGRTNSNCHATNNNCRPTKNNCRTTNNGLAVLQRRSRTTRPTFRRPDRLFPKMSGEVPRTSGEPWGPWEPQDLPRSAPGPPMTPP